VTTSWDDGHQLDAKLAEELHNHGFSATFYISPQSAEIPLAKRLDKAAVREIGTRFEIGSHTLTHRHLTRVPIGEAIQEISQGNDAVQQIIGSSVTSFCYPYGAYRGEHVEAVRAAGFHAARTIRRFRTSMPADPLQMGTTTHAARYLADTWTLARRLRNPRASWASWYHWDLLARQMFDAARAAGGVYHLWGHSWEIESRDDWARLRSLLRYIAGHEDAVFVTNGELARQVRVASPASEGEAA
jgi:peptidoglycan/xylan/chitin deacetylase (PgdA/CDA1 family)